MEQTQELLLSQQLPQGRKLLLKVLRLHQQLPQGRKLLKVASRTNLPLQIEEVPMQ
jgi:hypothetical protein